MVTVQSFTQRQTTDGRSFITLELIGGMELIQSQNTGKFYATVRKCSMPATFNEDVAAGMVGSKLPGEIIRMESEPYQYTVKSTGEVITLHHSYGYQPAQGAVVTSSSKVLEMV
jgi:hypothetical protein